MSLSFNRQPSKEAIQETTKSIKSSFTEGSSKIFGSVKKGFFDGISSTFDQVVHIVATNEEEASATTGQADQQTQQAAQSATPPKTDDDKKTQAPAKPKPPKPPAPLSKQRSEQGSNSSLNKSTAKPENTPPNRPFLKRRNTNPFMEDYEPGTSEADLPSAVVAEVYQMVSALYSEEEGGQKSKEARGGEGGRSGKVKGQDDADSEGTEGCDDVADLEAVEEDGRSGTESKGGEEHEEFMRQFVAKVFDSKYAGFVLPRCLPPQYNNLLPHTLNYHFNIAHCFSASHPRFTHQTTTSHLTPPPPTSHPHLTHHTTPSHITPPPHTSHHHLTHHTTTSTKPPNYRMPQ